MSLQYPDHKIILASGSPRRKKFFEDMGFTVDIQVREVDEVFPTGLVAQQIPAYLAELKASAFSEESLGNSVLITSDTIVWHKEAALGKPKDHKEATAMLSRLSADTHWVYTAVCFTYKGKKIQCNEATEVTFAPLSQNEIEYYVGHYKPYDKAGAYGIQEWLGLVGITKINGSYNNVVGLPTQKVYATLKALLGNPEYH
ncbi:Maf family nucleotide pyrophosphatase [Flavobacteriaceae bacterium]|nr:Maf family nucleotide pyrophosphatase [Flavobacteriaceae bacterium]MDC1449073.1 Maf family nucleotide pyrophosphatase [Flavobacteriaceae bacterium]